MKAYSLIVILVCVCCFCKYTSVEIMPEFEKNILNFHYGINFKYKGMFVHSFDRFYVVKNFILSSINDLKFLPLDFDEKCNYLNEDFICDHNSKNDIFLFSKYIIRKLYHLYIFIRNKFLLIITHT